MAIVPGTRLGPYEILAPIGSGGMGEVWRARDTRLERAVAVKTLPAEFAQNVQLRLRLEREAKTISQLHHPNICTIFDVGENYIVMELLEGESLAERIARGPLPADQVVRIGVEIAAALDRAHRQGVVHRDLKPANVMLTRTGAKLLDFGLAKGAAGAVTGGSSVVAADGATMQKALTAEGTIVGTFQYMAPEQLEGLEADARTDIFALGCVLYEMATGRRAFEGKTRTSLIAAIVGSHPAPMSSLQPLVSPALDRIVSGCLAKDPDERWQNAHDVALQLKSMTESAPAPAPAAKRNAVAWLLAAVSIVAALAFAALWRYGSKAAPRRVTTAILPPDGASFSFFDAPAISPDGTKVAFTTARTNSEARLYVRDLAAAAPLALAGTEGASFPFWSPDSRSIGFFAGGKLKRIDASGGPPESLCDAQAGRGGAWSRDGVILFTPTVRDQIYRVPAAGGTPVRVTAFGADEYSHRYPAFLPDGKHFLYLSLGRRNAVYFAALDAPERREIGKSSSQAIYARPGFLLFSRDRTLLAQKFDPVKGTLQGDATPITARLRTSNSTLAGAFTVSDNGVLVYQNGADAAPTQLTWFDRSGKQIAQLGTPRIHGPLRISHDGRRVAVQVADPDSGKRDIWMYDSARGTATRFTSETSDAIGSVWSPDDSKLAYSIYDAGGLGSLMVKATSGIEPSQKLAPADITMATDWSRDGRTLLLQTRGVTNWALNTWSFADRKIHAFPFAFAVRLATLSPDGRWMASVANDSGPYELYLESFPDHAGRFQVSGDGANSVRWRGDGRELFYLSNGNRLMAVAVTAGATISAEAPVPLFEMPNGARDWDATPDGRRFLVSVPISAVEASPLTVVQNWTAGSDR